MYKLVAIVNQNVADGFRLAGIEVVAVQDDAEARTEILSFLESDDVGIIALDERYHGAIDERLEKRLDAVYRPVLVMLPLETKADMNALTQQRLSRLIRRAVGFDVTLKRG